MKHEISEAFANALFKASCGSDRNGADLIGIYHMLWYLHERLEKYDFEYWIKEARKNVDALVEFQTKMETLLNAEYAAKVA